LQDAAVLDVGGRKNLRRFAGQKNAGVGAVTVNEAANDDHGARNGVLPVWQTNANAAGRRVYSQDQA